MTIYLFFRFALTVCTTYQTIPKCVYVLDAPAVDTSSGIYQIGLSMSKFIIGLVPRELENFRPGFFELQIRRIGFFKIETFAVEGSVTTPSVAANTISKQEAEKKRPTLLKIFSPIAKVFFSEQR
jgi:hypothetical protein